MKTSLILGVVLCCLPAARAGDLPGTAYALPPEGTVLRAGPSPNHPGVLTLDGSAVVRVGELVGSFREVFVAQGFPVFMHSDYVAVTPSSATVDVTGDHVNLRLLPSTEGLVPIGQLSEGCEPLVFLEQSGEWVRVLAPVDKALYAPDEALKPEASAELADRWETALAERETRRAASMEAWRSADPSWQREAVLLDRTERLADVDVTRLDETALTDRRAEIARLRSQATWAETQTALAKLDQDIDQVLTLRSSASKVAEQSRTQPFEFTADGAARRESRMLALGFRYLGRGESVRRAGSVHREGLEDAPVFTLHTTEGEVLKLTAPADVATLQALVGRQVEFDGRKLFLATVMGPVLVVDKIVAYKPG
jgi:hypothetical protein